MSTAIKKKKLEHRTAGTKFHVKKGDDVVVISGEERGKRGRIRQILPAKQRVIVEGLQQVKVHKKRSQDLPNGAIVEQDGNIHVSNLMLVEKYEKKHGKIEEPAAAAAEETVEQKTEEQSEEKAKA
jgi:large subunit ribosomal protein L24